MNFEKAKKLITLLLIFAVVSSVAGFIAGSDTDYAIFLNLASGGFLILAIIVLVSFCKCPHCGKRIVLGVLKATYCPNCHRHLVTGEKMKKSGKKSKY